MANIWMEKRSLPKMPTLSHLKMKRPIMNYQEIFLIHVMEFHNEIKNQQGREGHFGRLYVNYG